jgi:hypothetical protein
LLEVGLFLLELSLQDIGRDLHLILIVRVHHIYYEVDMKVEFQFLAIVIRVLNLLRNQLVPDAKEICLLPRVKTL